MKSALLFSAGLLAGFLLVAFVDEAGRPDFRGDVPHETR